MTPNGSQRGQTVYMHFSNSGSNHQPRSAIRAPVSGL